MRGPELVVQLRTGVTLGDDLVAQPLNGRRDLLAELGQLVLNGGNDLLLHCLELIESSRRRAFIRGGGR